MGRTLKFRQRASADNPWPAHLTPGDRLHRLYMLAPSDALAIIRIVDDQLRHRWPTMPKKQKRSG